MSAKKFVTFFLGLFGGFFVLVGLVLLLVNSRLSQGTEEAAALPLFNAAQLSQAPPGTVALIEGRIAERNTLHAEGFAVYLRRLYRGERCDIQSGTATPKCEDVWTEEERVTPAVWLDLPDGRIHLANTDYALQHPPAVWQSTGTLIKNETVRYEGFKLNSPVFAQGTVIAEGTDPAFKADFLYGGSREVYFADQQSANNLVFWLAVAFIVIGGGILLGLGVSLLVRRKR